MNAGRVRRATASFAVLAALVLGAGSRARAELSVQLVAIAEPREIRALRPVLVELLARLPVRVSFEVGGDDSLRDLFTAAAEPDLLARVWIDVSQPRVGTVYISNVTRDRFLVRSVPLEGGNHEALRESLAHIVESAVDAMLAGAELGVSREVAEKEIAASAAATVSPAPREAPAAPPAPPPPSSPRPSSSLADVAGAGAGATRSRPSGRPLAGGIGAFYRADALASDGTMAHGPGIDVTARRGGDIGAMTVSGRIAVQSILPFDWSAGAAGARFWGGAGRVELAAAWAPSRAVVLDVAAVLGVDLWHASPRAAAGANLMPSSAFWLWAPVAGASAGASVRLGPRCAANLRLGADRDLAGHHFDVVRSDQTQAPALSGLAVRPWVSLGLAVPFGS